MNKKFKVLTFLLTAGTLLSAVCNYKEFIGTAASFGAGVYAWSLCSFECK